MSHYSTLCSTEQPTGLESHHVSRYYIQRQGAPRKSRLTQTIAGLPLITGAVASQDSPQFLLLMYQATQQITWTDLLADADYDAEHNHRLCRQTLEIPFADCPQ